MVGTDLARDALRQRGGLKVDRDAVGVRKEHGASEVPCGLPHDPVADRIARARDNHRRHRTYAADAQHGESDHPPHQVLAACNRGDERRLQQQEAVARGCAIGGCEEPEVTTAGLIGDQDQVIVVGQPASGKPGKRIAVRRIIGKIFQDVILVEFIDGVRIAQIGQAQPMLGQHVVH